jgi:hypothetical protein
MGTPFDTGFSLFLVQRNAEFQSMSVGEAICRRREVVNVVNRPQDIEDEEAMTFFGGEEGDADESQG